MLRPPLDASSLSDWDVIGPRCQRSADALAARSSVCSGVSVSAAILCTSKGHRITLRYATARLRNAAEWVMPKRTLRSRPLREALLANVLTHTLPAYGVRRHRTAIRQGDVRFEAT